MKLATPSRPLAPVRGRDANPHDAVPGLGEDADDVGAALDLLVQPLERVGA
jgi:hypothetical protein